MSVSIEIPTILREYSNNQSSFQVNGETVGEALRDLGKQSPGLKKMLLDKDGKLMRSYDVFVNGKSAYPQMMTHPVKDNDKLNIIMLIQGG
jgi:molybdopterin converting factor small subunit